MLWKKIFSFDASSTFRVSRCHGHFIRSNYILYEILYRSIIMTKYQHSVLTEKIIRSNCARNIIKKLLNLIYPYIRIIPRIIALFPQNKSDPFAIKFAIKWLTLKVEQIASDFPKFVTMGTRIQYIQLNILRDIFFFFRSINKLLCTVKFPVVL